MAKQDQMCIIGFGRMGRRAAEIFDEGYGIQVVSSRCLGTVLRGLGALQAEDATDALRTAAFVVLAVPVDALGSWIPRINASTSPDCLVIECCTARVATERALQGLDRPSFGLPELGGGDQPVVGEPDPRIVAYLDSKGIALEPVSAAAYDRDTGAGTAQFLGIALQSLLDEDLRAQWAASPAGGSLLALIRHLETNAPATYYETQVLNANMSEARKRLISHLTAVDRDLDAGRFTFESASRAEWRP